MSVRGFEPRTTWLKVKCSTDWATRPYFILKCPEPESNQRHMDFQSIALPTELSGHVFYKDELRGQDLNLRPSGYEPDELPDCSTPRRFLLTIIFDFHQNINSFNGRRWIRTTEASCSRFTVCPLWPLGNLPWSWWWDLNPQPADYKSAALPIELHQHIKF